MTKAPHMRHSVAIGNGTYNSIKQIEKHHGKAYETIRLAQLTVHIVSAHAGSFSADDAGRNDDG